MRLREGHVTPEVLGPTPSVTQKLKLVSSISFRNNVTSVTILYC